MPRTKSASVYVYPRALSGFATFKFDTIDIVRRKDGGAIAEARRKDGGAIAEALPGDALVDASLDEATRSVVIHRLEMISRARAPLGDLPADRPLIMGILNVTPDSFSDGGRHADPDSAIDVATAMVEAGADIIDVGGESTRPGARQPSADEEHARVIPVVSHLAAAGICVSIDTRRAAIMRAAIGSGALMVNDISALTADEDSLGVVAQSGVSVV